MKIKPWLELTRRSLPFCLLALFLVAMNSSVFFGDRTLVPITSTAALKQGLPYGYEGPRTDWTSTVDPYGAYNASHAYDMYTATVLKEWEIPYWNPYQGLGQPFLANYLSAVFYPVNWFHLVLPHSWWDLIFLFNWLLVAAFTYAYLRLVRIDNSAALLAGATIFASGYAQMYVAMREVLAVAAWWPLLIYGVERCTQDQRWRYRHIILAIGVFCSVTGGQPEVTFFSLLTVLIYAVIRAINNKTQFWSGIWSVAPGAVAGLLMSAPIWLNFAEYAFMSAYSFHPSGGGVGERHLRIDSIASYFFPYIYGRLQTAPFGIIQGWHWDYSPGWFPVLGLFLVVAATMSLRRARPFWLMFFVITSLIVFAKIWGFPLVNDIGKLPIFDRAVYPRYAGFLLMLPFSAIAAYGAMMLSALEATKWKRLLAIWFVIVALVFVAGIRPVWSVISESTLTSVEVKTFALYGSLGLLWAIVLPVGLWIVKARHITNAKLFYSTAIFGILLQGVSYAANGYSDKSYALLSIIGISIFVAFIALILLWKQFSITTKTVVFGLSIVGAFPLYAAFSFTYGLPFRYDPLTKPPYVPVLEKLQNNNMYRAYSVDGAPFPNFSAPLRLSNVTNLDALTITSAADFASKYLDRGTPPIWFAGNFSPRRPETTAYGELRENARYFDLIGTRYIVTDKTDPRQILYDDTAPSESMIPRSLEKILGTVLLKAPTAELSGVEVLLGTYNRANPGKVVLYIFDQDRRTLLRQSEVDSSLLKDNSFQKFSFDTIANVKGKKLLMELEFKPQTQEAMIATYVHKKGLEEEFVIRILEQTSRYTSVFEDQGTGIQIWENYNVGPRVFLAPTFGVVSTGQEALSRLPDTKDLRSQVWLENKDVNTTGESKPFIKKSSAGNLISFMLSPNDVWITYDAFLPGILTLTDSYAKGWRATVDGVDVPVLRVDGVFRGVKLEKVGKVNVHFWYRPPYWQWSLILWIIGFVILLASSTLTWRKFRLGW